MDKVVLSSELSAKPKTDVLAFFSSVFSGVEQ